MSKMFQMIGVKCPYSDMDVGNPERPHIKGYREVSGQQQRTNSKHWNRMWQQKDFKGIDFIYMMNFGDVDEHARYYAQFRLPIFVHLFGQYNIRLICNLIDAGIEHDNIFLVCYSKTEMGIYHKVSFDHKGFRSRIHYIPFALDPDEFDNWDGSKPKVYTTCNDFQNRQSCNFPVYQDIVKDIPHVFSGRNTEEVGGIGLQSYDDLKSNYQAYRMYLSMGTIPAPYTLTPLEAMMTGCPTAIYDNGMGISDEGILSNDGTVGIVSNDLVVLREYIQRTIDDKAFADDQSNKVRARAMSLFHLQAVAKQWKELLSFNV
tara:strand:+ start:2917 stop:3867 length:951 start_codon:yes stop_codon:yes gene_type:complete